LYSKMQFIIYMPQIFPIIFMVIKYKKSRKENCCTV